MKLIHKRALSLLLSAAMVLTMLPVTALALGKASVYLDSNGRSSSAICMSKIGIGTTDLDSGWYLMDSGNVTINQTITVSGDVNLILADGANLTVNGASDDGSDTPDHAGIKVPQGSSLSIYAQSTGSSMGRLTATGLGNGAGIGSAMMESSGNITICGGRITAKGGSGSLCAPGIGNMNGGSFGTIAIYGGMVTATNGFTTANSYPDIGGCSDDGDEILIRGGTVVSGRSNPSVNLGVNGNGYMGKFPKVVIDGGSINGWIGPIFCKNSAGNLISLPSDVLTVPGQENAAVSSISIDGVPYGNSVYTDGSGNLYLHLPAYDSVVPIVVTMDGGSEYWAVYQPDGNGSAEVVLVNAEENPIFPGTADFSSFLPKDITVYKLYPDQNVSGIRNGNSDLTKGTDYTVDGDHITIKKEYLKTLPVGVTSLTLSGLGSGDATLSVNVSASPEYVALGDSIPAGVGLSGYDPEAKTPLAGAYPSLVGNTLDLTTGSLAQSGMNSGELLAGLSDPEIIAYLSKAKVITLSIGSDDLLIPFLNIIAQRLGCDSSQIQGKLIDLAQNDSTAFAADIRALDADDGSGLKNNHILTAAASGFAQNFQGIISAIKTAAPNAKIYVTNVYNPYEKISLPYGSGMLDLGASVDGYIKALNGAFSANSPDYTLIDAYSDFSGSLRIGTSLVNVNRLVYNFDPHPNTAGQAKIADMILAAYTGNGTKNPIITTSLSMKGLVGAPYSLTLEATGKTPIKWSIASSALPNGLTLNPDSGVISGTPTSLGTFYFVVTAKNDAGSDARLFSIEVSGSAMSAGEAAKALSQLSSDSPPSAVSGVTSGVLSLSPSEQAQLPTSQIAVLEGAMQNTLHVAAPVISAPLPSGFSGSAALPGAPIATGLTLATYGASSATLSTTQASPPAGMPGGILAFDLNLTEGGVLQPVHSPLAFPVTVTMPLPPNFVPKAGAQYHINHTLMNRTIEQLPVTIGGTPGHYTATFTTFSFSMFTLVETADESSSDSSVSVPESGVTPSTFISDTNADFSVNGAYQFKITSQNGIAPLLTVGTPGVFETQLVRVSGNDYYFKLISVGKAGEKAGIYVNGVKLLAATVGTSAASVKSDTTGSFKVAKGKTYTFKLTADGKPSFVCGNSSVFLVKFLRQSGKDYFYQVTAVGKPGQAAGFYLNASKKPVAAAAVA